MNHDEQPATVAVVKGQLENAPLIASPVDDVLASFGDVKRRLDALASFEETLWSINDHLAHIEQHALAQGHVGYFLRAIEKNSRRTSFSVAAINANFSIMGLVALFWSAFLYWKNYDDIHGFVSAVAAYIAHFFRFIS